MAAVAEWNQLYIGGHWVEPAGPETFEVVNPTTELVAGRLPLAGAGDVDRAVSAARSALDNGPWPHLALEDRVAAIEALGAALAQRSEELVRLIVTETGLPSGGTVLSGTGAGQVAGTFELLRASVEAIRAFPFQEEMLGRAGRAIVRHEPIGVVGAIVPWNGPLWSAMMKLAPALMAGCACILKPSPLAPLDSMVLAEYAAAAGFPDGVLSVLPGGTEAGERLVAHPGVDKISFTGSTAVGRAIAASCAANLTRCNLELGGKSAAVVLDDADLDQVIPVLLAAGLDNNGESCTALTRILVSRRRHGELVETLAAAVSALVVGDPFDPAVDVGPLISADQRRRVEAFLTGADDAGVTFVAGGGRPAGLDRGWFVEPTVADGVTNDMPIAREEIFGPVLAVIDYDTVDEAVALANDSPYGLCGGVFTSDEERGIELCGRIRTGTINVNRFVINIEAPLGGFKSSGLGREYGSAGIREFVEIKTINLP
jgi:aldehyde dehydrogenase (NAD+)